MLREFTFNASVLFFFHSLVFISSLHIARGLQRNPPPFLYFASESSAPNLWFVKPVFGCQSNNSRKSVFIKFRFVPFLSFFCVRFLWWLRFSMQLLACFPQSESFRKNFPGDKFCFRFDKITWFQQIGLLINHNAHVPVHNTQFHPRATREKNY